MKENSKHSSIFIVPRDSTAWKGNEAGWITASGWAAAGKELWGEALVVTTDGTFAPEESMTFPRIGKVSIKRKKWYRDFIPEIIITAYKDWSLKRSKPKVWPVEIDEALKDKKVKMIWERHDLFSGPGRRLATKYQVPLVISVEALTVWEAKKWGIKRPVWGEWLEQKVEARSLRNADLVCCVSEEVREKVVSLGVEASKVVVTPNRVDSTLFHPGIDGSKIENKYKLKGKRVLGWTGSFRNFHALDDVIKAFEIVHQKFPDTVLMLVGDGMEYEPIKQMVNDRNLSDAVIMPGKKKFIEIPGFVANFHISLVSARSAEGFHYSPLKLREYMAAGKAVVAPNAGDLSKVFEEGRDLLFYEAGNFESLSNQIVYLLENREKHRELVQNAKSWFHREGSWKHELKRVCDLLNISY